ncbi:hypothetical protein [Alicyclobacillus sp. SP_1]|nr:hypothetical protein [Alicyclobacillus sp. SP_1]
MGISDRLFADDETVLSEMLQNDLEGTLASVLTVRRGPLEEEGERNDRHA